MLIILLFLFHNVIQHPLAGIVWCVAEVCELVKLHKAANVIHGVGDKIHDGIWNYIDRE